MVACGRQTASGKMRGLVLAGGVGGYGAGLGVLYLLLGRLVARCPFGHLRGLTTSNLRERYSRCCDSSGYGAEGVVGVEHEGTLQAPAAAHVAHRQACQATHFRRQGTQQNH